MSIKSGPMLGSLEAETMHILREVAAEARNPVFLYSVGKDSAVMLHIAMKAFYPAKPPFSFLHVDTTWKFREMIEFRDKRIVDLGLELIVHTNSEGLAKGVSPFTHGATRHTEIMKTEALLQALEVHEFDVALGGARRDEEISRAKERVFSFRTQNHLWEPKSQRPELWSLSQREKEACREHPCLSAFQLDRDRYLGIYHGRGHRYTGPVFCQATSGCGARRYIYYGG